MRYQAGHKEEKRKHLLKASGALAKKNGFEASGVDALMRAAGVTSGAFYSHFASKAVLLQALITSELSASRDMWAGNPHQSAEDWLEFELDRYLNIKHVQHPETGCMLPSLGAEIARADLPLRQLYQRELRKGQKILRQRLGSDALAWAFLCQLVGAILMARALPGATAQRTVLEASKGFLKQTLLQQVGRPVAEPAASQPGRAAKRMRES
jgi:AcrR family transcriptional regulator